MKTTPSVSILVSSCDKYEDAWIPFFTLLKKYWPDRPYPVYLSTERKTISSVAGVPVTTINDPRDGATWSARLIHALRQIKSDYVLFFLEDFFLMKPVEQKELDHCVSLMEAHPKAANINFGYGKDLPSTEYLDEKYAVRSRNTKYYLNAQAALWRRKTLLKLLSPYENAWQYELYGSERAKLYSDKFVIRKDNFLIFEYHTQRPWLLGIQKGMWLPGNVEFFEKEGITVPFENLGFYDPAKENKSVGTPPKRTLREKWMRLLFAGESVPRWTIGEQIKLLFAHPVRYLKQKKHALEK